MGKLNASFHVPLPVYSSPEHTEFMCKTENFPRSKRKQVMYSRNMAIMSLAIFLGCSSLSHFPYLSAWVYKEQMYLWLITALLSLLEHPLRICHQSMTLWSPSVWKWRNWKGPRPLQEVPAQSIEKQIMTSVLLHLKGVPYLYHQS